jgi:hypothetical protein
LCNYDKGCVFVVARIGDPLKEVSACRNAHDALNLYSSVDTTKANYFPTKPSWCFGTVTEEKILSELAKKLELLNEAAVQQKLNEVINSAGGEIKASLDNFVVKVTAVFRTEDTKMSLQITIEGKDPDATELRTICTKIVDAVKNAAGTPPNFEYKCTLVPVVTQKRSALQTSKDFEAQLEELLGNPGSASAVYISLASILIAILFILF